VSKDPAAVAVSHICFDCAIIDRGTAASLTTDTAAELGTPIVINRAVIDRGITVCCAIDTAAFPFRASVRATRIAAYNAVLNCWLAACPAIDAAAVVGQVPTDFAIADCRVTPVTADSPTVVGVTISNSKSTQNTISIFTTTESYH
jgi:hypothetical protein